MKMRFTAACALAIATIFADKSSYYYEFEILDLFLKCLLRTIMKEYYLRGTIRTLEENYTLAQW